MNDLEKIAGDGKSYQKILHDRIIVLYKKVKVDKFHSPELLNSMNSYKLLYDTVDTGDYKI